MQFIEHIFRDISGRFAWTQNECCMKYFLRMCIVFYVLYAVLVIIDFVWVAVFVTWSCADKRVPCLMISTILLSTIIIDIFYIKILFWYFCKKSYWPWHDITNTIILVQISRVSNSRPTNVSERYKLQSIPTKRNAQWIPNRSLKS